MSTSPASEHHLVRRARAGDEDAFAELVMLHADRVYGALRRFGLDEAEADEVSQEVFLRAWRGLARFEERARVSTWLYRIAFNEAQRRRSRRALPRVDRDPDREDPIVAVPDSPELRPERPSAVARVRAGPRRFACAAACGLAGRDCSLRDIEGLSTEEAAGVAGVRPAAFKSRLHRGRMQLRALLEPYLKLEEG